MDKTHVVWNRQRGNSDLSTPVLYQDHIYMIAGNGVAVCVHAATGEEVWTDRIGGTFVASPLVANGRIYFCNEEGETAVLQSGDQFTVLSKNNLAEGLRSSPSVSNGAIYLRTFKHLYKIAE